MRVLNAVLKSLVFKLTQVGLLWARPRGAEMDVILTLPLKVHFRVRDVKEPLTCRGVLLAACGPHAAQDGCECGPTQDCKFT